MATMAAGLRHSKSVVTSITKEKNLIALDGRHGTFQTMKANELLNDPNGLDFGMNMRVGADNVCALGKSEKGVDGAILWKGAWANLRKTWTLSLDGVGSGM